eukprot:1142781-Pelagomonas_calceolata.AAC.2
MPSVALSDGQAVSVPQQKYRMQILRSFGQAHPAQVVALHPEGLYNYRFVLKIAYCWRQWAKLWIKHANCLDDDQCLDDDESSLMTISDRLPTSRTPVDTASPTAHFLSLIVAPGAWGTPQVEKLTASLKAKLNHPRC